MTDGGEDNETGRKSARECNGVYSKIIQIGTYVDKISQENLKMVKFLIKRTDLDNFKKIGQGRLM
jgi:hypothetical protein